MKYAKYFALMSTLTMMFSFAALAKDKNAANVNLPESAHLGSTQVPAGDYKVEWTGNAPDVQVQLTQHGKTVATAPAKLVENSQASPYSSVVLKDVTGESKAIDEIDFANRKEVLKFNSSASTGE